MSYNNDWSNEWADHNQLIDLNERLKKLEAENAELEAQITSLEYQLCEKISCQCESLKSALAQRSFEYQKLEAKNGELEKKLSGNRFMDNDLILKRLHEGILLMEKFSSLIPCDAVYVNDCQACDIEDFIRVVKDELNAKEKDGI